MSNETRTGLIRRGSGESADVLGIKVIFVVTKEMSGGAFSLFTNIAPRGARVPMHTHRHDHETMVVQRGRIVCHVEDETFTAEAGDTVHMPAGVPHGWRTAGDEDVELLVIFSLTPDSDYERMFREVSGVPLEDIRTHERALAANALDMTVPPVYV